MHQYAPHGFPWSTTWTALSAVGTVGAVIFAVVAALRESRRARIAEERARAVGVSAWMEEGNRGASPPMRRHVVVANLSDQPVFDVTVLVGVDEAGQIRGLATGQSVRVRPQSAEEVTVTNYHNLVDPATDKFYPLDRLRVTITFRDTANNKWRRGYDGVLAPNGAASA